MNDFATWVNERLVNRRDAYGRYRSIKSREERKRKGLDPGKTYKETGPRRPLCIDDIWIHCADHRAEKIVGLHAIERRPDGSCWCRWIAIDIDFHSDADDPDRNLRFALEIFHALRAMGFDPILLDSNGCGGFHVLVVFAEPIPSETAFWFVRWVARDWDRHGFTGEPECYPKQPRIEEGKYGNWLRAPGCRHHTRPHRARVFMDGEWLSGIDLHEHIIATKLGSLDMIPAEVREYQEERARVIRERRAAVAHPGGSSPRSLDPSLEAEKARDAAMHLGPSFNVYPEWFKLACALKVLGPAGLDIFIAVSSSEQFKDKYNYGACVRLWDSIDAGKFGGVTLGSLYHWARAAGWRPKPEHQGWDEPESVGTWSAPWGFRLILDDEGGDPDGAGDQDPPPPAGPNSPWPEAEGDEPPPKADMDVGGKLAAATRAGGVTLLREPIPDRDIAPTIAYAAFLGAVESSDAQGPKILAVRQSRGDANDLAGRLPGGVAYPSRAKIEQIKDGFHGPPIEIGNCPTEHFFDVLEAQRFGLDPTQSVCLFCQFFWTKHVNISMSWTRRGPHPTRP